MEIVRLYHDMPIGGHEEQWKIVELVTQNFWWPGVTKEMKRYMKGCDTCQCNKNCTEQPAGKLMLNSILEKPWTHILADFTTKLPLAQGYNSILVVVNRLTKMVHFIPTTEKTTAEGLARLFRDNMQKLLWRQPLGYLQNADILPFFISFPQLIIFLYSLTIFAFSII